MDLYDELGVTSTASTKEIKKAYRSNAQKYHPDKEGGDPEKFHTITVAYQTLKDKEQRQRYDETGEYKGAEPDDIADRIVKIFLELVTSGKYDGDLVQRGLVLVDKEDAILVRAKRDIESDISAAEKLLGRLVCDTGGPNLFEKAISLRVEGLKGQLRMISHKTEELEQMRQSLRKYTDTELAEEIDWTGGYIVPENTFSPGNAARTDR